MLYSATETVVPRDSITLILSYMMMMMMMMMMMIMMMMQQLRQAQKTFNRCGVLSIRR